MVVTLIRGSGPTWEQTVSPDAARMNAFTVDCAFLFDRQAPVEWLKSSLRGILPLFPPTSGRFVRTFSGEIKVLCGDAGIPFSFDEEPSLDDCAVTPDMGSPLPDKFFDRVERYNRDFL